MKILFMCKGNTCRSPMAELLMKDISEKEGLEIDVYSRGLRPIPQRYRDEGLFTEVRGALLDYNPDIKGLESFESTQVEQVDLESADLILTIDPEVTKELEDRLNGGNWYKLDTETEQEIRNKVHTLRGYIGDEDETIEDPVFLTRVKRSRKTWVFRADTRAERLDAEYALCRDELVEYLTRLVEKIKEKN